MNKLLQVSLGTLLLGGILSFNHAHSSDEENSEEFPPIEWLVEDEGGASENYYLSNSETLLIGHPL